MVTEIQLGRAADSLSKNRILTVLLELSNFNEMLWCRNKNHAWRSLRECFTRVVNADQCVFFLATADQSLTAPDFEDAADPTVLIELSEALRGDQAVTWVRTHEHSGDEDAEINAEQVFLNGRQRCTIWCVFRDELGRVLGVMLASRDQNENDGAKASFGEEDKVAAELLSNGASRILELLRALKLFRDLREQVYQSSNREEVFRAAIRTAVSLLGVSSGGVIVFDPMRKEWVHGPQFGERDVHEGQVVPLDEAANLLSIESAIETHDGNSLRSVMSWGGSYSPFGVLEVNAVQGRRFGDSDRDKLDWVASHAASDCALVDKHFDLEIWESELVSSEVGPYQIAMQLLDRLKADLHCVSGVVYRAMPRTDFLLGFAGPNPNGRDLRVKPYIFETSEPAVATYAYRHGDFMCTSDDQRVNQQGREDFAIDGQLCGLTLRGSDGVLFGSLVIWWDELLGDRANAVLQRAKKIVKSAAGPLSSALFTQTALQRETFQQQVANVLQQMTREAQLQVNAQAILDGIIACGFTRVRLYAFRYGDTLTGIISRGMGDDSSAFDNGAHATNINHNYYTRVVYEGVCRARNDPENFKPEDLLARMYPARSKDGELIPDENVESLKKPPGMPWVDVPLISAGKFYGLISADKRSLDGSVPVTWGDITDFDLDVMDSFAQLASRAFSMEEKRGMLIQRHIRTLDDFVTPGQPFELVKRRLMLFLAHGEEGLSFSRVLFFAAEGATYRLDQTVGSASEKGFQQIHQAIHEMSLHDVMAEADLGHDQDLRDKVRSVVGETIAGDLKIPETVEVKRYARSDSSAPAFIRQLRESKELEFEDCLVARVTASGEELGLILVDRVWDPIGLIKADEEALQSFSRHAAQVLRRHQAVRERFAEIETVARGIVHETRSPLMELKDAQEILRHPTDISNLPDGVDQLESALGRLHETVNALKTVFFATDQPEHLSCHEVIELVESCRGDLENARLHCVSSGNWQPIARAALRRSAILVAIRNLLRNTEQAARQPDTDIYASAKTIGSQLVIEIADNGPGVSSDALSQLRKFVPRGAGGRLGFGLFLVRWIAEKHGGRLHLWSEEGKSFTARLLFPIVDETH
ncbi:MAG: HAMP domain-containing sensor histidine kinase [Planctomycetota bacterium]